MTRPLRIEFPGAIYHVTSRGDRREPIFEDDEDRLALLDVITQAMTRFDAEMVAYCLMGNHYHFVLGTREANLSRLMRHINGVYTQRYNRRHGKSGHLFQGRFKAILVDREAYLLEVCRYVELNPVRAGLVAYASDWGWSSFLHHTGKKPPLPWLGTASLYAYLLGRSADTPQDQRRAASQYEHFVAAGHGAPLWDAHLRQQIYLGDEEFVTRMQALAEPEKLNAQEVSTTHRREISSLATWLKETNSREEGAFNAYTKGGFKMREIAAELGVSLATVSLMVKRVERR